MWLLPIRLLPEKLLPGLAISDQHRVVRGRLTIGARMDGRVNTDARINARMTIE